MRISNMYLERKVEKRGILGRTEKLLNIQKRRKERNVGEAKEKGDV